MQETCIQSLAQENLQEKGMATHSSILVWEIPWTEEPVGLQSMGSQRIKHELATRQQQQIVTLQSCVGFKFRYLFKQHF